jgi:tRNA nucleotidyltransferase (CCA-adding enzyme)
MIEARWEHFSHQADVGVRGIGATREEAFQQAAVALTAVITNPLQVVARDVFELELESREDDLLLVDWLNRLIYEMSTRGMVFSRFDVWVETPVLRARVWGEKLNTRKHKPAVEVKAATYHQAAVYRDQSGVWIAQCVVDV